MIHIYCGDGKGKTTAAMGLALRAAGRDWKVIVVQFLKGANSGERFVLEGLPCVTLLPVPEQVKFSFQMSQEERRGEAERFDALCSQCERLMQAGNGQLVILDEACAAVSTGLLPIKRLLALLDSAPEETEIVLTGRNPPEELLRRADYVTEMKKVRHPFDQGLRAREGIEF